MISDEERRAVAARMREIMRDDPHGWLDVMVAKAVANVLVDGVKIGETVADLIDRPTCRNVADPHDGSHFECSKCGERWELTCGSPADNHLNYCPQCGAKVVEDV